MSGPRVDLHLHTRASDGCWSPEEVLTAVLSAEIGLFSVTDHDTTAFVDPVARLAAAEGVGFIPGVEICSTLNGQGLHILGYGIDPGDVPLKSLLKANWGKLEELDTESIRTLIMEGYPLSLEAFSSYENDRSRGGWKALNFMIDAGVCSGVDDFFGRLFTGERRLRLPDYASAEEVIHAIHRAGGRAVWAHPGHHWGSAPDSTLSALREYGIDGLECYSHYHDSSVTERALDFCRRHHLLITAGSDSHGPFAGRTIGHPRVTLSQLELGNLWNG